MKIKFCLMIIILIVVFSSTALPIAKADDNLQTMVKSNNAFGFDLYHKFKGERGNLFFSPYSISTAFAMTYEGAKGQTAKEIQTVLHLPDDKQKIRSDFVNIYNGLNKKGIGALVYCIYRRLYTGIASHHNYCYIRVYLLG